jgi:hypothetical protein
MVTSKPSSTSESPIGAKPVDKSGLAEPKLTHINVEGIWSVEYCRQHPKLAAQAIETLQWMSRAHDEQVAALKHAIEDIRKLLG